MKTILKKSDNPRSIWNNLGKLLILTMAGSIIYLLPYFRFYYYDTFLEAFGLNNTQMGMIGTVYGFFGVLSYLVGGILANKFSARSLLTFSFLSTGLTGLILLAYPPYQVVLVIQAFWGFSTLMTFWPALVKAVNMLGTENEKGKSFGFMEGGRGVSNVVYMSSAVALFGFIAKVSGDKMGLTSVILFYSILDIVMAGLVFFFVKLEEESGQANEADEKKLSLDIFIRILKNKFTWMIIIMMYCSYSMNIAYTYFTPYATSQFGTTVVFAAVIAVIAQYVRPFAAAASGTFGDKIGTSKMFSFGFILLFIGVGGVLVLPTQQSTMYLFIASVAACYIAMYSMQALHFTLLEEAEYPKELLGVGIGIICTFGYLPEMVGPIIAGKLLDTFPGSTGYRYLFVYLLVLSVIGFVTSLVWMSQTKERRKELLAKNK